jgi:hypothetical protein
MRTATEALLRIHGLDGRAAADVEASIDHDIARDGPMDEGKAAAMGGVLSGAVTGLAADLAAGGLTFGAGMLTGAILGALGGAGIARAVNVSRGQSDETIRWDDAFLRRLCALSLLRYLAVAHYGRGRGQYVDSDAPALWRARVDEAMDERQEQFAAALAQRVGGDASEVTATLAPLLRRTALDVLGALYPAAPKVA